MYESIIVSFIEKNFPIHLTEENITPEQFNEIIENLKAGLISRIDDIIQEAKNCKENFLICNDFLNHIDFKTTEEKDALTEFFFLSYFFIEFDKVISDTTSKKILYFNQDVALFQNESIGRIKKLKDELLKKHFSLQKIIDEKFSAFITELEEDINLAKAYYSSTTIEINGTSATDALFPSGQRRPTNFAFEIILLSINDIAETISPKAKYAEVIIPTMTFLANKFPDFIDKNDFNDSDKVRKRVEYLVANLSNKTYFPILTSGE